MVKNGRIWWEWWSVVWMVRYGEGSWDNYGEEWWCIVWMVRCGEKWWDMVEVLEYCMDGEEWWGMVGYVGNDGVFSVR